MPDGRSRSARSRTRRCVPRASDVLEKERESPDVQGEGAWRFREAGSQQPARDAPGREERRCRETSQHPAESRILKRDSHHSAEDQYWQNSDACATDHRAAAQEKTEMRHRDQEPEQRLRRNGVSESTHREPTATQQRSTT